MSDIMKTLYVTGFDGAAKADCGMSLPIIIDKDEGKFWKLPPSGRSDAKFYPAKELEYWRAKSLISLIQEDVPLNTGWVEPRVLYVSESFLRALQVVHPRQLGWGLQWQAIGESRWVAIGEKNNLEDFLEDCAQRLLASSTESLADFFSTRRTTYLGNAEDLAELALSAGRTSATRQKIYLRYGSALLFSSTPERLYNLFDFFFKREFSELVFEEFASEIKKFSDLLQTAYPIDRLKGDSEEDEIPDKIERLLSADDPVYIDLACQRFATDHPLYEDFGPLLEELAKEGRENTEVKLDGIKLKLLARDPFLVDSRFLQRKKLLDSQSFTFDVVRFVEAMRRGEKRVKPGSISTLLYRALKDPGVRAEESNNG